VLWRFEPRARLVDFRGMKESDARRSEGATENAHPLLPLCLADQREPVDICEMPHVELQVLPERACAPSMEVVHDHEQAELADLTDAAFDVGSDACIVVGDECPG